MPCFNNISDLQICFGSTTPAAIAAGLQFLEQLQLERHKFS